MKALRSFPLVELAVLIFAAVLSRDLLSAWQHSPHDRLGWLALLVWLAPLAQRLARGPRPVPADFYLLAAAILSGLLGRLAEVHFLNHVALVLALGAWLEFSRRTAPWLLAAVAWLPVFGWWLADCSAGTVLFFRLALALAGVMAYWRMKNRDPR